MAEFVYSLATSAVIPGRRLGRADDPGGWPHRRLFLAVRSAGQTV
nr:unnamed protein product [Digitaria exilis]